MISAHASSLMKNTAPDAGCLRRVSSGRQFNPSVAMAVVILACSGLSRGADLDPAVLPRLEAATVFIKIKAGSMQGSGSGFVMKVMGRDTVLIMTNRHVAVPDPGELPEGAKVELSVVFRSGTRQEQQRPATVIAHDRSEIRDLAVLEVTGVTDPPAPISADVTAKESELSRTMPVFALGFPLGDFIGIRNENPSLTVTPMSISNLQLDQDKVNLDRIQLAPAVIPGNSGGPIVDAKGRLVGVVVARLRALEIGFAIPPSAIAGFLAGDVGEILRAELLGPETQLKLLFRLVDPMKRLKSVSIRYAKQSDPAASAALANSKPRPGGGYPELPVGTTVPLMLKDGTAGGTVPIPVKNAADRKVILQFVVSDALGRRASKPIKATLPDRPGPFVEFNPTPKVPSKWSCEPNKGEGIKMTHEPGATVIDLPAGVALNNAPQIKLFNAPCSLVKVDGDFVALVQVADTFDPGGKAVPLPNKPNGLGFSFQSAGLLIWQDEKNFIRFERSKRSDGKNGFLCWVLVEIYEEGKAAEIRHIPVPDLPTALVAARKGGSLQLLFAMPPNGFAVFNEMSLDFNKEIFVGVAASNLSQRAYQARLENFMLKNLEGGDIVVKPADMTYLVPPPFVKLADGTRQYEGAWLKVISPKGAPVASQNMAPFGGDWSANKQLLWNNTKTDGALTLELPVDADGKYEIRGKFTTAPDYAVARLTIDDRPLYQGGKTNDPFDGKIDFYSPQVKPTMELSFGTMSLNKGNHKLTITVFRNNGKSSSPGYKFGLDEIRLVPAK
jgi:S1-C subfamily serine protease